MHPHFTDRKTGTGGYVTCPKFHNELLAESGTESSFDFLAHAQCTRLKKPLKKKRTSLPET